MRWCSPGQAALRPVLVLGPVGALAASMPAGTRMTPMWLLLLVVGAAVAWVVRPDGAGGIVSMTAVVGWWAYAVPGLTWWAVPAAALLVMAHLTALVAAHGPADLSPSREVLTLWGRRAASLAVVSVPVWGIGAGIIAAGEPAPGWIWPLAAVGVGLVGLLAAARALEDGDAS